MLILKLGRVYYYTGEGGGGKIPRVGPVSMTTLGLDHARTRQRMREDLADC